MSQIVSQLPASRFNRRTLVAGVALTLVLIAVAGCGRRGPLEPPPGATMAPPTASTQRLVAPVAQVTTSDSADFDKPSFTTPDANTAESKPIAVTPAPIDPNKPRKRFFLDPLVN